MTYLESDTSNFTLQTRPLHLETVAGSIGVDQGPLAVLTAFAHAVLHAQSALVTFAVEVPEDVPVIDLACAGLIAAGVIAHVECRDLTIGLVNVGNEVSLGDLLVVQVVHALDEGAVGRLPDLAGRRDLLQEQA